MKTGIQKSRRRRRARGCKRTRGYEEAQNLKIGAKRSGEAPDPKSQYELPGNGIGARRSSSLQRKVIGIVDRLPSSKDDAALHVPDLLRVWEVCWLIY